jgi:hypothetical protein
LAGTGRTTAIASAVALCLLAGSGVSAATIITGPGTPETLIHDARLTVSSSRAVARSVPPAPVRKSFVDRAAVATVRVGCLVAGTSASNAVGSSVGYLWVVTRCLGHAAGPVPPAEPLHLASLYLPPPPAPYWPARGVPTMLPGPGAGGGVSRPYLAPVPLPAAGFALPAALGLLVAFRLRRR